MPTNNPIVAALPAAGGADHMLLRSWAVSRNSFNLTPAETLQDFVMIDPDGGGTTPSVTQNGMLYGHDAADTTTAHDGVTCLVSYDAQRYKLETGTRVPYGVKDKDLTAPPVSPAPSYGNAYLIYGTPTGAWAGQTGKIAIFTARGWSFATAPIGFLVFVRDEAAYYHRDNSGAWTAGTGTRTLGANTVLLSNAVNFGKRLIVENQTTNTVPVSPAIGDAYICGPSWPGGNAGKIAICEDGSTFTIYTPGNGWAAYDKSQNNDFNYTGSAWVSARGAVVGAAYSFTQSGSTTSNSGTSYTASYTTAPTTSNANRSDDVGLSYTAKKTSAELRFNYQFTFIGDLNSGAGVTLALFRDSETTALRWATFTDGPSDYVTLQATFRIQSNDALGHTYKIRAVSTGGTNVPGAFGSRLLEVQEFA